MNIFDYEGENDPDFDESKADRNKDGKISDWERSVGNAVAKSMREQKEKKSAEEFGAETSKYFDEIEVLYGRQNHFTYSNLGSMAYNSLYMAARELGATPIQAFNLCNSKWVRHNEDFIPENMTEMFMNMLYRERVSWKGYIGGDGDYQITDYSRNDLWRGMQQTGEIQLKMNKQYAEMGLEGYGAESFESDNWGEENWCDDCDNWGEGCLCAESFGAEEFESEFSKGDMLNLKKYIDYPMRWIDKNIRPSSDAKVRKIEQKSKGQIPTKKTTESFRQKIETPNWFKAVQVGILASVVGLMYFKDSGAIEEPEEPEEQKEE